jgi:hypothetical protein
MSHICNSFLYHFLFIRVSFSYADPLSIYTSPQPLIRVEKVPRLINFYETRVPVIYGIKKDDPFYDGKRVDAAWVIQRAYR